MLHQDQLSYSVPHRRPRQIQTYRLETLILLGLWLFYACFRWRGTEILGILACAIRAFSFSGTCSALLIVSANAF